MQEEKNPGSRRKFGASRTATRRIRRREVGSTAPLPAELHPVVARLYAARNIASASELDLGLAGLPTPAGLKGMENAVDLLADALYGDGRILIVGDFDADGATSCALAVRALRAMGAVDVDYLVPNRFEYGYGLTPEIVTEAAVKMPDLIVTVDNGISSVEGVRAARDLGMAVLVTDHHLPGEQLPTADAIVNPNQEGDTFASKSLAGVGVIFYVMSALRARLRNEQWFTDGRNEPNLAELLDLVALGTVADVVPLDRVNRALVAQGLARINAGRCQPGVRALLEAGGRRIGNIVAADLGFAAGPRLNAAGRLEDMSLGIECLLTDDPKTAAEYAERLDVLNRQRREIEQEMKEQAMAALPELYNAADEHQNYGICLYDPKWHQGVIGILASRIREQTHRPVVAFAPAGDDAVELLKGSARSIPGLHIRDVLDAIAARSPGLLHKFGGHAMAAGLTLELRNLDAFTQAFDQEVARQVNPDDLEGVVLSDGELEADHLSLELAETLRKAGPWGQGFPEPVFDGTFEVITQRVVGERHLKLVLGPEGGGRRMDAIAFGQAREEVKSWRRLRVAYRLDVNEYQGQRNAQLIIEHMEPC